jgi:hypothetical protein
VLRVHESLHGDCRRELLHHSWRARSGLQRPLKNQLDDRVVDQDELSPRSRTIAIVPQFFADL